MVALHDCTAGPGYHTSTSLHSRRLQQGGSRDCISESIVINNILYIANGYLRALQYALSTGDAAPAAKYIAALTTADLSQGIDLPGDCNFTAATIDAFTVLVDGFSVITESLCEEPTASGSIALQDPAGCA